MSLNFRYPHTAKLTVGQGGAPGRNGNSRYGGGTGGIGGKIKVYQTATINAGLINVTCGNGGNNISTSSNGYTNSGQQESFFGNSYSSESGTSQVVTINGKSYGGNGGAGGSSAWYDAEMDEEYQSTPGDYGTGAGGKGGDGSVGSGIKAGDGEAGVRSGGGGGGGGGYTAGTFARGASGGTGFVVAELLS